METMEHTNETKEHGTFSMLISRSNKRILFFAICTENGLAASVKYGHHSTLEGICTLTWRVGTACSMRRRLSTFVTYISKELLETINIHRELTCPCPVKSLMEKF